MKQLLATLVLCGVLGCQRLASLSRSPNVDCSHPVTNAERIQCAPVSQRRPTAPRAPVPVQFEAAGSDATYVHGTHCIDMRAF